MIYEVSEVRSPSVEQPKVLSSVANYSSVQSALILIYSVVNIWLESRLPNVISNIVVLNCSASTGWRVVATTAIGECRPDVFHANHSGDYATIVDSGARAIRGEFAQSVCADYTALLRTRLQYLHSDICTSNVTNLRWNAWGVSLRLLAYCALLIDYALFCVS